jgi:hypothetical protein
MAAIHANYDVIRLTGTQGIDVLGDGVTASTVHRIYCLAAGSVDLTPMRGAGFTFTATANQFIDVLVKGTKVNSGSFIGFRSKHVPTQFFGY